MDLWGFEGRYRHELPGDGFGLFVVGGDGAVVSTGGANNGTSAASTPPSNVVVTGAPVVASVVASVGGTPRNSTLRVAGGQPYNEAQDRNIAQYRTYRGRLETAIGSTYVTQHPVPSEDVFLSTPGAVRTYLDSANNDSRVGVSPDFQAVRGEGYQLVDTRERFVAANAASNQLASNVSATEADRDRVVGLYNDAVATEGQGRSPEPARTDSRADGGDEQQYALDANGVARPIARTNSYVETMNGIRDGGIATSGAIGGLMSPAMTALGGANVIAAQSQAFGRGGESSFGMDGGGVGFGASAGPGGTSFGMGDGVGGFGGIGGFGGLGGDDVEAQGRKIDKLIQMLLAAIMSGNTDAISSALILLEARSKKTLAKVAGTVVQRMAMYNKQMEDVSRSMGAMQSNSPQFTQAQTRIQVISGDRQMAANMLRDVTGMVEEAGSLTKSWQDFRSRQTRNFSWS